MIRIRNSQQLARLLRQLRETAGMSRRDVAGRLFITPKNLGDHETGRRGWNTDATIDIANIFGFDVALVPQAARRPGARPTGTGWPT